MIASDSLIRLRPSVAFVPQAQNVFQFFMGNTRASRIVKLEPNLARFVTLLDGRSTIKSVAATAEVAQDSALALSQFLFDNCLCENADVAERIRVSEWRRVLNFLGDFFPSHEVEAAFERICATRVVVLGVGAVGSWCAIQLARSGVSRFCVIDPDHVERSNLNRSLYVEEDVGRAKVTAIQRHLLRIRPDAQVETIDARMGSAQDLQDVLNVDIERTVVLNCADEPSVDATSELVNKACQTLRVPYVIAGGYNLHLGLIGLTVLPGRSACYACSTLTLSEMQGRDLAGMRKLHRPWRNIGNLGPLAAATSAFTTNEVLRVAVRSRRLQPAMLNRRGELNFLTGRLHFTELPLRSECGCAVARTAAHVAREHEQ